MSIRKSIALLVPFIAATLASSCFDKSTYYGIDRDIEVAASKITDEDELVHFFGGIVRLGEFLTISYAWHDCYFEEKPSSHPLESRHVTSGP